MASIFHLKLAILENTFCWSEKLLSALTPSLLMSIHSLSLNKYQAQCYIQDSAEERHMAASNAHRSTLAYFSGLIGDGLHHAFSSLLGYLHLCLTALDSNSHLYYVWILVYYKYM